MMTRELVALMAATLAAADSSPVGFPEEEHVKHARRILKATEAQGVDRVRMDAKCDLCGQSVLGGFPPTFEFDSRQWVLMLHEPMKRRCGHVEAPLRFTVDYLEAPL